MPFSAVGMNYCQENMKAAVLSKFNSPSPPPKKQTPTKGRGEMMNQHSCNSIRFDGFHQEVTSPQNPHKFGEEAVNSRIPHTNELTQGCGVGLADVKLSPFIDITLFDTQT